MTEKPKTSQPAFEKVRKETHEEWAAKYAAAAYKRDAEQQAEKAQKAEREKFIFRRPDRKASTRRHRVIGQV